MTRISRTCLALVGAMLGLAPIAVLSQSIYRCGNAYSQTRCANGIVVRTEDLRTPDQKAQTDAATWQAAQMAARMERDRLTSENKSADAAKRPAGIGPGHPPASKPAASRRAGSETSSRKQPDAKSKNTAKALSWPQAADHFIATAPAVAGTCATVSPCPR